MCNVTVMMQLHALDLIIIFKRICGLEDGLLESDIYDMNYGPTALPASIRARPANNVFSDGGQL